MKIGNVDQREQDVPQGEPAGGCYGVTARFRQCVADGARSVPDQRDRFSGISGDRTYYTRTDGGVRGRRNAATHSFYVCHVLSQFFDRGGGEHGKRAHSGKNEGAPRLGFAIETADAFDEFRPVGEIDVVDSRGKCGFDQPIAILAVGLKRPAGVDDEVGMALSQLGLDVAVAVERQRDCASPAAKAGAELGRLCRGSTGDEQSQRFCVGEQVRQAPAECAVAAQDQHPHAMNRS